MAAKITSYIDAGGNKRTGYIIDGSTFQDEQGLKSVEKGSIVDAGGKRYVKGVGQNGSSMLLEDYLKSRNMNPTNYVDSQGVLKGGYIKDGQTYADILATTPVEKGSLVSAGGKTWIKGMGAEGGSMLYSDYIKNSASDKSPGSGGGTVSIDKEAEAKAQYEKKLNAGQELYAEALKNSEAETQRRKEALEGEYAKLGKQLYRDYMTDRKKLPQLLAAQGITGGLSESSLLGLEAGYQSEMSENLRRRLSDMGDIELEAAENRLQLYKDKAEAEAKAEEDYAEALLELAREREHSAAEEAEQMAKAEKLLYTRALEKAEILAGAGDFSGYRALGYSEAEIAAMEKAYSEEQFATRLKNAQQKARYGNAEELLALLGY